MKIKPTRGKPPSHNSDALCIIVSRDKISVRKYLNRIRVFLNMTYPTVGNVMALSLPKQEDYLGKYKELISKTKSSRHDCHWIIVLPSISDDELKSIENITNHLPLHVLDKRYWSVMEKL